MFCRHFAARAFTERELPLLRGGGGALQPGPCRKGARERGYGRAWGKASRRHRMANPLRVGCSAVSRLEAAEVTDHTIPHRGDQGLFWGPDNWQGCCTWRRDVIKQRLERAYVASQAFLDDLKLDIARAISLTLKQMRSR